MKKQKLAGFIVLFLCLSLLAACAPGAEQEPQSQPSQSEEAQLSEPTGSTPTEPTEAPQPTEPESSELEPLYTGQANVKDLYRGKGVTAYGVDTEISFPYIDLPGEDIAALNLEFLQDYMKYVNEDGVFEINKAPSHSYKWYVNGDILSLIIAEQDFAKTNRVYNIRISTCKLMETDEVLAAAGVTEEDFYDLAKDILGNAYFTRDYVSMCVAPDEDPIEYFYLEMTRGDPWILSDTVSQDNVSRCIPYMNENGELCFSGRLATGAGYGWGSEFFVWNEDYEKSPHYEEYLKQFGT